MAATGTGRSGAWVRLTDAYAVAPGEGARLEALCVYVLEAGPVLAKGFGRWPILGMAPEDAASEAAVRVTRHFHRLAPADDARALAAAHANWAFVVIRHVVRDWQRAAASRAEWRFHSLEGRGERDPERWDPGDHMAGDARDEVDATDEVVRRLDAQGAAAAMRATLDGPDAERLALLLDAASGRGYGDLAEAWGLTRTHFRTKVIRARRALALHPAAVAWRAAHA
jgi:DNA-directed RNA polymerase specialized sigma24 family protein